MRENTLLLLRSRFIGANTTRATCSGGNSHIHYAIKANTDKRICRMISNYGLGADCVSGNEIIHALKSWFHSSKIVFLVWVKLTKKLK